MKKLMRLLAAVLALTMLCEMLPLAAFAQSDIGQAVTAAVQEIGEENSTVTNTGSCGGNVTWSLDSDGVVTVSGTGEMGNYGWYGDVNPNRVFQDLSGSVRKVVIEDGVKNVGSGVFFRLENLTDVTIPDSVTSIGVDSFNYCTALESITLPETVTFIDTGAFANCHSLKKFKFPSGITCINDWMFHNSTGLTSVVIPASVTRIGVVVFEGCTSLQDIYYEGTEEQWNQIDIGNSNSSLANATIHYNYSGTEEEPNEEFTFGRDNFRFAHSATSFFADESDADNQATESAVNLLTDEPDYNHYNISKEKFDQLTAGLSASQKEKIRQKAYARWGGSCYGLSLVAMMHYASPVRVPLDGFDFYDEEAPENIYNLKCPHSSTSNTDLINYYYLTQNLPSVSRAKYLRAFACALSTKASITNIINALQENIPVIVSLKTHAVVLLTILSETDTYYLLRVYDPNMLSNGENQTPSTMKLYKNSIGTIKVDYPANNPHYKTVPYYYLATETYLYDPVNYFGVSTTVYSETADDVEVSTITAPAGSSFVVTMGKSSFTVTEGEITACTDDLKNALVADNSVNDTTDGTSDATVEFLFPQYTGELKISFTSDAAGSMDILWNNSFVSVLTDGVTSLTYDESARTVDVKADDPTAVSLLMTQNTVNDSWPWHSWAVDTTGTTTLHAELDSEGLHLTGDGLTDAKYATENADTEQTSKGTINVQPDETGKTSVTIINKNDGDTDDTEVKGEDKAEETTYTVTVNGGTASPAKAKEGETVTITAEKTDTFQNWTVVAGGITLENENLPTTTFTMGKENVVITANYSSGGNITPPSPGEPGQSPSDDGGAGIVLAIGAAATVAAGIGAIALMPVKVEGKVELADHTALPGAKIALLQNGKVVAQTTTDADGKFALKVKRGSYELTAAYTDANGQLMHKTASFKAPAKNLTVTF